MRHIFQPFASIAVVLTSVFLCPQFTGAQSPPSKIATYIEAMLPFEYDLELAYHAGLCGLRSEAYMRSFQIAKYSASDELARRLNLGSDDRSRADSELRQKFSKAHEGVPPFQIIEGCKYLRTSPSLITLDERAGDR